MTKTKCEFCDEKWYNSEPIASDSFEIQYWGDNQISIDFNGFNERGDTCIKINFCPFCGRNLMT